MNPLLYDNIFDIEMITYLPFVILHVAYSQMPSFRILVIIALMPGSFLRMDNDLVVAIVSDLCALLLIIFHLLDSTIHLISLHRCSTTSVYFLVLAEFLTLSFDHQLAYLIHHHFPIRKSSDRLVIPL